MSSRIKSSLRGAAAERLDVSEGRRAGAYIASISRSAFRPRPRRSRSSVAAGIEAGQLPHPLQAVGDRVPVRVQHACGRVHVAVVRQVALEGRQQLSAVLVVVACDRRDRVLEEAVDLLRMRGQDAEQQPVDLRPGPAVHGLHPVPLGEVEHQAGLAGGTHHLARAAVEGGDHRRAVRMQPLGGRRGRLPGVAGGRHGHRDVHPLRRSARRAIRARPRQPAPGPRAAGWSERRSRRRRSLRTDRGSARSRSWPPGRARACPATMPSNSATSGAASSRSRACSSATAVALAVAARCRNSLASCGKSPSPSSIPTIPTSRLP